MYKGYSYYTKIGEVVEEGVILDIIIRGLYFTGYCLADNPELCFHRVDKPAIIYNSGSKIWYQNGKRHREDGPAIEWYNGFKSWCLNGEHYNKEEFLEKQKDKLVSVNGVLHLIDGRPIRGL